MNPIYASWLIQIEITNYCKFKCAYCTRATRHFKKPYFADLKFIEKALKSLEGWKKGVGCMGGEPTEHPQFDKICYLYQKYFPESQCGLWTSGGKYYKKYKELIDQTFAILVFNDRTKNISYHRPPLIALKDVIEDKVLLDKLIDSCWLQHRWSPSITYKGAFFCEVAATQDLLFKGEGGFALEKGWWKKEPPQFRNQVDKFCYQCGIPLPIQSKNSTTNIELVSESNAKKLLSVVSPAALRKKIRIHNNIYSKEDINLMENSISRPPYLPSYSHDHRHQTRFSYVRLPKNALKWMEEQIKFGSVKRF